MKFRTVLAFFGLILFLQNISGAQDYTPPFRTSQELKDSVKNHFLKRGAWKYSYFEKEWQLYLDSAIAITPDYAYLWQQKAMPYFKRQQHEVGMQYLDKAVALDPAGQIGYRAYIKCAFAKTYSAALIDFDKCHALNGNGIVMDHYYDFYQGICYLQLKQNEKAIFHFKCAMQLAVTKGDSSFIHYLDWFYLGIANYEAGNYQEAKAAFESSLKHYPQFTEAHYYLGLTCARLGNALQAKQCREAAKLYFAQGYGINEDNMIYEQYPYQVKAYMLH